VRLPFDYRGISCFVTICSDRDRCTFAKITDGKVLLKPIGRIIEEEWLQTQTIRPDVILDEYQIMPNHFHLVVYVPEAPEITVRKGREFVRPPRSVSSLLGQFKAGVTRRVREWLRNSEYEVWQRGFYDRVIRNEEELERTRAYIRDNPINWATDPRNPRK
ncbi:MAG TPA: transposase, partial [Thermoanaerobaculia bacterium]|nr:transposase [Thermoanaerobaculia bacterium]